MYTFGCEEAEQTGVVNSIGLIMPVDSGGGQGNVVNPLYQANTKSCVCRIWLNPIFWREQQICQSPASINPKTGRTLKMTFLKD